MYFPSGPILKFSVPVKLMTKNSKSYKRPVSVRRTNLDPADKKFDLVYVLDHLRYLASLLIILFFNLALRYHLAKLNRPEPLEDRTLFWKIRACHLKPQECFYLPQVVSHPSYSSSYFHSLYSRSWGPEATRTCSGMLCYPLVWTLVTD